MFSLPLATAPLTTLIEQGQGPNAACPGSAVSPAASPGHLCIYEAQRIEVELVSFEDPLTGETGGEVTPWGADVTGVTGKVGDFNESGSWAVTAP